MDGLQINQKIRFGYAKAAEKLGQPFSLYRPTTSIDPLNSVNLVGVLPAVASMDWTWMKSNKPGNAIWFLCIDGQDSSLPLAAVEGDFIVGDHIFYILSKEYQLPMQGMECNATIKIVRPTQSIAAGGQGYAGFEEGSSELLVSLMPASILMQGRGKNSETDLPTDTTNPNWIIMMPNYGDVHLRTGDIVIDNTNENYILSVTEDTEFGWRLTAQKVVT
jgi:hypothetical protein